MLDKKFNLISEYSLNRSKLNFKILAVYHPPKLIKNTSKEIIKRIYDSNLKIEHKKFIINKIIGLTSKKSNIAQTSKIFTDYNKACSFKKDSGFSIKTVTFSYKKQKLSK
jgi:hypothetical protein